MKKKLVLASALTVLALAPVAQTVNAEQPVVYKLPDVSVALNKLSAADQKRVDASARLVADRGNDLLDVTEELNTSKAAADEALAAFTKAVAYRDLEVPNLVNELVKGQKTDDAVVAQLQAELDDYNKNHAAFAQTVTEETENVKKAEEVAEGFRVAVQRLTSQVEATKDATDKAKLQVELDEAKSDLEATLKLKEEAAAKVAAAQAQVDRLGAFAGNQAKIDVVKAAKADKVAQAAKLEADAKAAAAKAEADLKALSAELQTVYTRYNAALEAYNKQVREYNALLASLGLQEYIAEEADVTDAAKGAQDTLDKADEAVKPAAKEEVKPEAKKLPATGEATTAFAGLGLVSLVLAFFGLKRKAN